MVSTSAVTGMVISRLPVPVSLVPKYLSTCAVKTSSAGPGREACSTSWRVAVDPTPVVKDAGRFV